MQHTKKFQRKEVDGKLGNLTFPEMQSLLQISRPTLKKLIDDGKISAHRIGRKYIFLHDEVVVNLKSL